MGDTDRIRELYSEILFSAEKVHRLYHGEGPSPEVIAQLVEESRREIREEEAEDLRLRSAVKGDGTRRAVPGPIPRGRPTPVGRVRVGEAFPSELKRGSTQVHPSRQAVHLTKEAPGGLSHSLKLGPDEPFLGPDPRRGSNLEWKLRKMYQQVIGA